MSAPVSQLPSQIVSASSKRGTGGFCERGNRTPRKQWKFITTQERLLNQLHTQRVQLGEAFVKQVIDSIPRLSGDKYDLSSNASEGECALSPNASEGECGLSTEQLERVQEWLNDPSRGSL